jgi:1-acyl-sn-glycerol-3-phosphate acyltransferase
MVEHGAEIAGPTRRTPFTWQTLMTIDRAVVSVSGRVRVTGGVGRDLRGRSILLAPNHIGNFDALALIAACHKIGLAPKFLIAGGMMDAPVLGRLLRSSGHLRVDRGKRSVVDAFDTAVTTLRDSSAPVVCYPEGRISRDPGLWPERGKTGVARMALAAGVPVVPVSSWGAHEAVYWGTEVVSGPRDVVPLARSFGTSWLRRPTFQVHFGEPVDLGELDADRPGDARIARDRIMRSIVDGLIPLRRKEMERPHFHDPTRPTDRPSPWAPE